MKKIFAFFITLIILTGCSSNIQLEQLKKENEELRNKLEQYENTTFSEISSTDNSIASYDNKSKTQEYEFTKYSWISDFGTSYCAAIVFKNITQEVVDATIDILFKDADGNIIGVDNNKVDILIPNREVVVWATSDTIFSDFDVNVTINDSLSASYALNNNVLKIDENQVNNKIILTTTNTSDKKVHTYDEVMLFFKDNKVVDFEILFMGNTDGIEPLGTSYVEVESSEDFDSYKLYYNGYCEN